MLHPLPHLLLLSSHWQGGAHGEEAGGSSQRTSSMYAREALIEIDYSDLSDELKVGGANGAAG